MFQNLKIYNFRGISELEITNFRKINFIIGDNGIGKSTILDALYLASAPSFPGTVISINNLRNLQSLTIDSFANLFYDKKHPIEIKSQKVSNATESILTIKNENSPRQVNINGIISNVNLKILKFEYSFHNKGSMSKKENSSSSFTNEINNQFQLIGNPLNINQINIESNNQKLDFISTSYLKDFNLNVTNSDFNLRNFNEELSSIFYNYEKELLVTELKKFQKNIKDVNFNNLGEILIDIGNKYIDSRLLGDGFMKFIKILIFTFSKKSKIILIDEIENGLHYSKIKLLIENIVKFSNDKQIQFFITTHNQDILKELNEYYSNDNGLKMDFSLIKLISKKEGGIKSINYELKDLNNYFETEEEIR